MSALAQQEDVADAGKDDESNSIDDASANAGNASGDAQFDENLNPDTAKQTPSAIDSTGDLPKPMTPERVPIDTLDEKNPENVDKFAGDTPSISSTKVPDTMTSENEDILKEISSDNALDNIQSIGNVKNIPADTNIDPGTITQTGYKETVIDDASDLEFELRWSDDENDGDADDVPLSDEALKRLDLELGIDDVDNTVDSKEVTKTSTATTSTEQSHIEIEKSKESVVEESSTPSNVVQNSIEDEKLKETGNDDSSQNINTAIINDQISMDVDKPQEKVDDHKLVDESESKKVTIKEQIGESGSGVIISESKAEIQPESVNITLKEDEKPMDVDIPAIDSKSLSDINIELDQTKDPSIDDGKMTELVKEIDVDMEDDKISEIGIDETVVDIKHLIDQDEDTIKELGLDVEKSDLIVTENKDDHEATDNETELLKATSDIQTSLNINLSDTPKKVDATESTSSECLQNSKNTTGNDIDIAKVETSAECESTPLINEPNSVNIAENNNTNGVTQTPKSKTDIPHKIDSNVDIEDSTVAQVDKAKVTVDDNAKIKVAPTDQSVVETDPATHVLETITNVDENNILKDPSKSNLGEDPITDLKETEKILEDFIIPKDETDDSIKINTEHRINRPDVMLDIPTQEFDFDEFDDSSEMQGQPNKTKKDESDLTSKTVTEIVNQLAKETENMGTDKIENTNVSAIKTVTDSEMKETSATKTTENVKSPEATKSNDIEMTSDENISIITENAQAETMKTSSETTLISKDVIDEKSPKKDYIPKSTDQNVEKSKIDPKSGEIEIISDIAQPSTSTESSKDAPNKIPLSQDNDKTSEVGSKIHKDQKVNLEPQPSTSTEITTDAPNKIPLSQDDDKNSEAKTDKDQKVGVEPQPSTSEDITEEAEEVEDGLGLLAESSRVIDDDDDDDEQDQEEDEADDNDGDDDEDFDPDDESSNLTEEHSEESNPPHSEVDIKEEGIDIEFNSLTYKMGLDSNDASLDAAIGDSTDITLDENETTETVAKEDEAQKDDKAEEPSKQSPKAAVAKPKERRSSILADLLTKPAADMTNIVKQKEAKTSEESKTSDSKKAIDSVVDLGGSSSEDDAQANKDKQDTPSVTEKEELADKQIGVPDATSQEATGEKRKDDKDKAKSGEIFSLDSDDDGDKKEVSFLGAPRENNKCINYNCVSDESVTYYLADRMTIAYYGAARRRKRAVCQNCLDVVSARNEGLVSGIKDLRPLMSLRMARPTQTLLEISDSDSEGEDETVGEEGAKFLEDKLTEMLNDVWLKYNMDDRLKDTEDYLLHELEKMQKDSEEVDKLLRDCQKATDELRVEFYSSFEGPRHELPGISIHDTPIASYACLETEDEANDAQFPLRYPKRRSTTTVEVPAKKHALTSDDRKMTRSMMEDQIKTEEDKDISVVRLSAESAPADLPPPGELVKPPLKVGAQVYAMKNQYGAWLKGRLLEIQPKTNEAQYTICRVKFEHKVKNPCKMLTARSIAYTEPCEVRMTIGTRVIALFKNCENTNKKGEFYYSGVVAEIPNPVNSYRYLVFFDDGYAQYVEHKHTRLVYESKTLVWEEVHPFSRDFVCNYLMKYPERPMVRMHPGQELNVEWNGKWWDTKVIKVDAALVHVQFPDNRTEWIYRGSTRLKPLFAELLAAKRGDRARLPRSTKANIKTNVPYVEYTRSDDQVKADQTADDLRRQRSVAKKSTTIAQQISNAATDGIISRVVFYTPKNSVRPLKMVSHNCGPHCKRSDLLSLKDLRTYNPLTKPLLSGWERQIVRHKASRAVMYRAPCGRRLRCVRELHRYLRAVKSDMPVDLFDFNPNTHCLAEFVLNKTNVQKKDLSHGKENVPVPCVNYYDHSLPEFCSYNTVRTPTAGVPLNLDPEFLCGCDCDDDCAVRSLNSRIESIFACHSLPEFCSYNTVRTPTAGVPLNLDPEFLCGCDCDDDCADKTKCACWKMTLEGARTIGIEGTNVGYDYRRLPEPLPTGIYECNSRCKCKSTCLNRVVQNPLQLKLQVFKTLNRGWGIRALNDVPKGAFICIYAGNLLTDATANLDGLNEGDEYLAELDYIEVVESMKEGYEDDIPEADKELDKKESKKSETETESESTESEEEESSKKDTDDGDFQPGYLGFGLTEFNKRLRRRDKKKNKEEEENKEPPPEDKPKKEEGEECITISDDEEVRVSQREPSRFAAQESMTDNKVVSKYRSIRSYFGKDEACYIMDAKVQGNIGRYLNHSCSPNVFVQNVFVDTHDPRFPWVSFFALQHIRAGTELTWNYNYDIGSVPGKVLYCYCSAPNCRGRLL